MSSIANLNPRYFYVVPGIPAFVGIHACLYLLEDLLFDFHIGRSWLYVFFHLVIYSLVATMIVFGRSKVENFLDIGIVDYFLFVLISIPVGFLVSWNGAHLFNHDPYLTMMFFIANSLSYPVSIFLLVVLNFHYKIKASI